VIYGVYIQWKLVTSVQKRKKKPSYTTLSDEDDWEKVCKLLEVFNFVTNIISGNLYLDEVFRIKQVVDKVV